MNPRVWKEMICMLDFKRITIEDADILNDRLCLSPSKQLVDCFEAFYLWKDVFDIEYAVEKDLLVCKMTYEGETSFFYPFGKGDVASVLRQMEVYCVDRGIPFRLTKVASDHLASLDTVFPGCFTAVAYRENAEYIYTADCFRSYSGSALQSKRNFVNYARKNYAWNYEPVSEGNLSACADFASEFDGEGSFDLDSEALTNALSDYTELALDGGIIRVNGKVAALLICAALGDGETAAGLFLRGRHEMKGVIPLLYQEFFKANPRYKYFNLAEDLGLEGLRKNKLSYNPTELLELYEVSVNP